VTSDAVSVSPDPASTMGESDPASGLGKSALASPVLAPGKSGRASGLGKSGRASGLGKSGRASGPGKSGRASGPGKSDPASRLPRGRFQVAVQLPDAVTLDTPQLENDEVRLKVPEACVVLVNFPLTCVSELE
jgi:hypothetical protein